MLYRHFLLRGLQLQLGSLSLGSSHDTVRTALVAVAAWWILVVGAAGHRNILLVVVVICIVVLNQENHILQKMFVVIIAIGDCRFSFGRSFCGGSSR